MELLTYNEVCERLKVSRSTVARWVRRGEVESVKLGASLRIPASALQELTGIEQDPDTVAPAKRRKKDDMSKPDVPYRRRYRDGREVWVARYTHPKTGERMYARPDWNRGHSTFELKRDAQRAISEAIDQHLEPRGAPALRDYAEGWLEREPRSERTNKTNRTRLNGCLDVEIEGRKLGDYQLHQVRRKHGKVLLDHLLRVDGRAQLGARNILSTLSGVMQAAVEDELIEVNPIRGIKVRANDPRIRKPPREPKVWSMEQMHEFAAAAPTAQGKAMIRVLSDCGLRLGEMLALERIAHTQGGVLRVKGTAHNGVVTTQDGETKLHDRVVPLPASTAGFILRSLNGSRSRWLFPNGRNRPHCEGNFRRDVWALCREATGLNIVPHDMRHSWCSHMAAAGVDPADLAAVAGHRLETMMQYYVHSLDQSNDKIRSVIG